MVERCRDQPAGLDLGDPGGAGPGQRGMLLEVGQRPLPGRLVGLLHLPADPLLAERPQRRDGLDRGEDQVHAGDRLTRRLRRARDKCL